MNKSIEPNATLDQIPTVSQKLKLLCTKCGKKAFYDVGAILYDQEGEGKSAERHYSFTNYFHCRHCGSSGPWDVVDLLKVAGLALRSLVDKNYDGFYHSRCALFD